MQNVAIKELTLAAKGLLKTPYLLATVIISPTNQTRGEVNRKKTTGSLRILTRILLELGHPSYCLLVKRIV